MKYLLSDSGEVFAYAADGSDDGFIQPGLRPMTDEEVEAYLHPAKALDAVAAAAMAEVNAEYIRRMGNIADAYPQSERESWPIQLAEAKDLMTVGDHAVTPWMDQCAVQRGLTRMELAQRIVAKDAAYRHVSGFFSGVRQWHEDSISLLLADGEVARGELEAYNPLRGWEPAE